MRKVWRGTPAALLGARPASGASLSLLVPALLMRGSTAAVPDPQTLLAVGAQVLAMMVLVSAASAITWWFTRRATAGRTVVSRVTEEMLRLERQEASRVAVHLHSGPVQSLLVASYLARGAGDGAALADQLAEAEREVRDVISETRAPELTALGFGAACQVLQDLFDARDGLSTTWDWSAAEDGALPVVSADMCWRFLRETLANVSQHSGSPRAHVTFLLREGEVVISVQDDGVGFDTHQDPFAVPAGARAGGLSLLAARGRLLGARLSVTSDPGTGATVTMRAPLPAGAARTVTIGRAPDSAVVALPTMRVERSLVATP